jgi:hypothetical protein
MAIGDTIIPSIEGSSSNKSLNVLSIEASAFNAAIGEIQTGLPKETSRAIAYSYLKESASTVPGLKDLIQRTFCAFVRPEARKGICVILSALE